MRNQTSLTLSANSACDSMHRLRKCHDFILFGVVFPAFLALYFHSRLWFPTDRLRNRFCALCVASFFTALFAYRKSRDLYRSISSTDNDRSILDIIDDGWAEVKQVFPPRGTRTARARMFEPGREPPHLSPRQIVYQDETIVDVLEPSLANPKGMWE